MLARPVSRASRSRPPSFITRRTSTIRVSRTLNTLANWEPVRLSARNIAHLTVCSKRPSTSASFAFTPMATLSTRRPHTTQSKGKEPERRTQEEHPDHDHDHDHDHHDHSHSHSHSLLGSLAHTHSHAEESHADAEKVVEALRGRGASWPTFQIDSTELIRFVWVCR